jgi:hypothetical protein
MALIDQQEAAKLIRQNKDTHEDCQGAIHYNIGCEHSAQIVEQMKGQEIIRYKDCEHWKLQIGNVKGDGLGSCDFHNVNLVTGEGFCYWADKRGKENGNE